MAEPPRAAPPALGAPARPRHHRPRSRPDLPARRWQRHRRGLGGARNSPAELRCPEHLSLKEGWERTIRGQHPPGLWGSQKMRSCRRPAWPERSMCPLPGWGSHGDPSLPSSQNPPCQRRALWGLCQYFWCFPRRFGSAGFIPRCSPPSQNPPHAWRCLDMTRMGRSAEPALPHNYLIIKILIYLIKCKAILSPRAAELPMLGTGHHGRMGLGIPAGLNFWLHLHVSSSTVGSHNKPGSSLMATLSLCPSGAVAAPGGHWTSCSEGFARPKPPGWKQSWCGMMWPFRGFSSKVFPAHHSSASACAQ